MIRTHSLHVGKEKLYKSFVGKLQHDRFSESYSIMGSRTGGTGGGFYFQNSTNH